MNDGQCAAPSCGKESECSALGLLVKFPTVKSDDKHVSFTENKLQ